MTIEALTLRNRKFKLWKGYLRSNDELDLARFAPIRSDLCALTRSLRRNFENQLVSSLKVNEAILAVCQLSNQNQTRN